MPFSDLFEDSSRVSGFCKKYKKHFIGISVTFVILVIIATAIGLTSGLKGKLALKWRFSDDHGYEKEGTIDKGVPTEIGNKIYTDDTFSFDKNNTLTSFPDYISGSYHYQLNSYHYFSDSLQLTFHAKSACDVYIGKTEVTGYRSETGSLLVDLNFIDFINFIAFNFIEKNEIVKTSNGATLKLYHKHFLIDEKLILPQKDFYGNKDLNFYGTIFVK